MICHMYVHREQELAPRIRPSGESCGLLTCSSLKAFFTPAQYSNESLGSLTIPSLSPGDAVCGAVVSFRPAQNA